MKVYVLHHVYESDTDEENVKLIGVYSSEAAAETAIQRLSALPGFREANGEFNIDPYELDEDNWAEGFVTE